LLSDIIISLVSFAAYIPFRWNRFQFPGTAAVFAICMLLGKLFPPTINNMNNNNNNIMMMNYKLLLLCAEFTECYHATAAAATNSPLRIDMQIPSCSF